MGLLNIVIVALNWFIHKLISTPSDCHHHYLHNPLWPVFFKKNKKAFPVFPVVKTAIIVALTTWLISCGSTGHSWLIWGQVTPCAAVVVVRPRGDGGHVRWGPSGSCSPSKGSRCGYFLFASPPGCVAAGTCCHAVCVCCYLGRRKWECCGLSHWQVHSFTQRERRGGEEEGSWAGKQHFFISSKQNIQRNSHIADVLDIAWNSRHMGI